MPLSADLATRLDATTLVQGFVGDLGTFAGSLNTIANPADPGRVSEASSAGGAFVPAAILEAVSRVGAIDLPVGQVPSIVQRIESTVSLIEQLSSRDIGADLSTLSQQLAAQIESPNAQGIPGTVLSIADLLKGTPIVSALGPLLSLLTSRLPHEVLPSGLADYLPALVSTIRVIAGLMVYETVLAEGERLSAIVANLFDAQRAQHEGEMLQASFQIGDQTLAQALASADPTDFDRVETLIGATESIAVQLAALQEYPARGMGFGEATLVHFDVGAAQAEIAAAGALLRDPDLGALRRVIVSLVNLLEPVASSLDPRGATARGMEQVLQLAEAQADQAAAAIRNLDASVLVGPMTTGISTLTAPLHDFTQLTAQVVTEIRATLERVRAAVAALPIDALATAIRSALDPVTRALDAVQHLVDDISNALQTAATAAQQTLSTIETRVDQFQLQITNLFAQARQFIDGLHLDQVVASIADKINEFVGLLQQAQLKPYFDAASSAIGAAADVVSKVPLNLLPESMKADLDTALAPVREVDPAAVETQIETLLQIGPSGRFELRADLEHALAGIQAKFDQLLATLDEHDPNRYLDEIDAQLATLATRIRALAPELTLEPIQQAIAQVKAALGGFDLAAQLQPVQAVFDHAIEALDQYSPAQLLQPLQQRVAVARAKLQSVLRIDDWRPRLDTVASALLQQLDVLDPSALDALLRRLFDQLQQELDNLPDISFGNWIGMIVAGLMRGSNLRIGASSIGSVLRWVAGGASASTELSARAARIAEALATAKTQVEAFDPASLAPIITQGTAAQAPALDFASRIDPESDQQVRLQAAASRLDAAPVLAQLSANRSRYLDLLGSAVALAEGLRRTGMSEADVAVQQLRQAFAPLQPLIAKARLLSSYLGIGGSQSGFSQMLRSVFSVATPARITGLFTRLVSALRDRLRTLIDQVLAPVRSAIDDLRRLINLLDLQPVIDGVQAVFTEVRNQVLAYSPNVLLHDQLQAFADLKQRLLAFDPLAPILQVLNALRDTAARVIEKLSVRRLLESPIAIYHTILNVFHQLNISTLLTPVLDALDSIAQHVDQGLDETVGAFRRLQAALPPPGGGSSASVSVSVG